MPTPVRSYRHDVDYERVSRFLIDAYKPGDNLGTWLQPRWEYMHHHSYIDELPLERIGVLETNERIVGVVHFEHHPPHIYTQVAPGHDGVGEDLLDYAETQLADISECLGRSVLGLFVDNFDTAMNQLVAERGYQLQSHEQEEHSRLELTEELPGRDLPEGFRLQSLAEDNDLEKIHRVLWRGFGHDGPPPPDEIEERRRMQEAPNYHKDLTMVVVAPNGDYASYCGMWYVPENSVAYVEPVATDPDYRRLGLGAAAVSESLNRVRRLGAEAAWVGSGQDFYAALGFRIAYQSHLWISPEGRVASH
ncbi:MAG: GNAT family N-acetyltransferase [Acidimicrobiia bacterium]|nr:GNAT family N-acetyltransferase [Acidimicrobiia bacterium]MDH3470032.1 GNAT family N-acetyltransferase [Acidimicrobiia bacterium]